MLPRSNRRLMLGKQIISSLHFKYISWPLQNRFPCVSFVQIGRIADLTTWKVIQYIERVGNFLHLILRFKKKFSSL